MQNTHDELHCLRDWACPGSLGGKKEFNEYYSKKMQQAQRYGVDDVTLGIGRDRARKLMYALLRKHARPAPKKRRDELAEQRPAKGGQRRLLRSLAAAEKPTGVSSRAQISLAPRATRGLAALRRAANSVRSVATSDPRPGRLRDAFDSFTTSTKGRFGVRPRRTRMNILRKVGNHLELLKPDPTDDPRKVCPRRRGGQVGAARTAAELGGADRADVNFDRVSSAKHCGKMLALEKLLALWHGQNDKVILFLFQHASAGHPGKVSHAQGVRLQSAGRHHAAAIIAGGGGRV